MTPAPAIPTARIEAFSDGVIAIIITIMVFDLKFNETPTVQNVWDNIYALLPKILSYAVSFLMLAIMWVNHHQLFHQIKYTDRRLLWLNIHLLFWMSCVPFATNFIGISPLLWQATFLYAIVFFMSAFSFTQLRKYVVHKNLLHDTINKQAHIRIRNKNQIALALYFLAAVFGFVSVYISFALFLVVPTMYFIPENIIHTKQ